MRVSEFQPEYGLIGAGAVNDSLVARLPRKVQALGTVAAVSFRVASRIVNSLGAGVPARSVEELNGLRFILFYSSPDQFPALTQALASAKIRWHGKSLVFCDCECPDETRDLFACRGAHVAVLRKSELPGRLILEGTGPALAFAHRLAKDLGVKAIAIAAEHKQAFEMALTLGSGALSPLIDQTAILLRRCGVRDAEASQLAAALFEQTVREYARTGRQSWVWFQRAPDDARIVAQLNAVGTQLRRMAAELILFGLEEVGRYGELAITIRDALESRDAAD